MNFYDRSNLAPDAGWTDLRVALLTKLWNDGLSASQVAVELGGVTRNAVIGKAHRIGLAGRVGIPSGGMPKPRKARSAGDTLRLPRTPRGLNAAPIFECEIEPAPEPELIEIPFAQRKTLLQLTEKTCHWPVGDPCCADFFFCGGETMNELPYCPYHSRVAYQPPSDRRRDKRPFRDGYVRSL